MAKYGLGCQAQAFPEHSGKGEVFHMFYSIPPLQRAVEHLPNLQMAYRNIAMDKKQVKKELEQVLKCLHNIRM